MTKETKTHTRVYPETVLDKFGENLTDIFGPEEDQKIHLGSLADSPEKVEALISKLPNGGILDVYEVFGRNARVNFIEVATKVLEMIQESGAFEGYKLPVWDELEDRIGGEKVQWLNMYLKYPVQREINVGHIVRTILVPWEGWLNDPAFCRKLLDGSYNVNDKQHGNMGRFILGAPYALAEVIVSDKESMDANMYAQRNIHNLPSSFEASLNNRVNRAMEYEREGTPVKLEDKPYYDFYQILDDEGSEWRERAGSKGKRDGVCYRAKDLFKHYSTYDRDIFIKGIQVNRQVWPTGELSHELVWAVGRLLQYYRDVHKLTDSDMRNVTSYIKTVLKEYYPDKDFRTASRGTGKGTFWNDVKDFMGVIKAQDPDDFRGQDKSKEWMMASALRSMMLNYDHFRTTEKGTHALVKIDLPAVCREQDSKCYDIDMPFKVGKERFSIKDAVEFNHAEIDFDEEEDDELETV
jgi:hypothetical protein